MKSNSNINFAQIRKTVGQSLIIHEHVKCPIYIHIHLCADLWFKIYYAR